MNTDKVLEELDKVPLSKIENAIKSIRKHYPDKDSDDIYITFEFLVGSFYPNILRNIKDTIRDTYTQGFIDGQNQNNLTSE